MSNLHPYISFENAKEALAYYKKVFGATNITRLPIPAEQAEHFGMQADALKDTTVHGSFSVLGSKLMCSDSFGEKVQPTKQISIMLDVNSEDPVASKQADDFFAKVEASGEVEVYAPYKEAFWGGKMGQFTDKYGITWMLHAQPYSLLEGK